MALEQSVNLDSKKKGGIIGITKKPGALERWFVTSHEIAAITKAMKNMCRIQEGDIINTHREAGSPRIRRDEADVQQILQMFESDLMTNPFKITDEVNEDIPLMNIASRFIVPSDIAKRLLRLEDIGKKYMDAFVEERLVKREKSF